MEYIIDTDNKKQWCWVFYAANGEPIARSSESYVNLADCKLSIELIKGSSSVPVNLIKRVIRMG